MSVAFLVFLLSPFLDAVSFGRSKCTAKTSLLKLLPRSASHKRNVSRNSFKSTRLSLLMSINLHISISSSLVSCSGRCFCSKSHASANSSKEIKPNRLEIIVVNSEKKLLRESWQKAGKIQTKYGDSLYFSRSLYL